MTGVLAVVAHPDDESFGLGAVISELVERGVPVTVLCFTHGEASTLHGVRGDLGKIRARELTAAGQALGVGRVELQAYADGELARTPLPDLVGHVRRLIDSLHPSHLLTFDPNPPLAHRARPRPGYAPHSTPSPADARSHKQKPLPRPGHIGFAASTAPNGRTLVPPNRGLFLSLTHTPGGIVKAGQPSWRNT